MYMKTVLVLAGMFTTICIGASGSSQEEYKQTVVYHAALYTMFQQLHEPQQDVWGWHDHPVAKTASELAVNPSSYQLEIIQDHNNKQPWVAIPYLYPAIPPDVNAVYAATRVFLKDRISLRNQAIAACKQKDKGVHPGCVRTNYNYISELENLGAITAHNYDRKQYMNALVEAVSHYMNA